MSRKKGSGAGRKKGFPLRFTPFEKELFKQKAETAGFKMQEYARRKVLDLPMRKENKTKTTKTTR